MNTKDQDDFTLRANALAAADNQVIFSLVEKIREQSIILALKDKRIKELEDAANNAAPSPAAE